MTAVAAALVVGLLAFLIPVVNYFSPSARTLGRLEREAKVMADLPDGPAKDDLAIIVAKRASLYRSHYDDDQRQPLVVLFFAMYGVGMVAWIARDVMARSDSVIAEESLVLVTALVVSCFVGVIIVGSLFIWEWRQRRKDARRAD